MTIRHSILVLLLIAFLVTTCVGKTSSPCSGSKMKILHVTDVHGWIFGHPHNETLDTDFGDLYSLISHMKDNAKDAGEDFFVFDTGDLVEGTGMSDATPTHGQYIFKIASQIPYDALTVGNHDLCSNATVDLLKESFVPLWNGMYINENTFVLDNNENVSLAPPFQVIHSGQGLKILLLGFMYNFTHEAPNSYVSTVKDTLLEPSFINAMEIEDLDLIIVLAHIDPQAPPELQQIHDAIRKYHPSLPVVLLGGHRHVNYFQMYDNNSFVLESGCYFEEVGLIEFDLCNLNIENLQYNWIPTNSENFFELADVDKENFATPTGNSIKSQISSIWNSLGLGNIYACLPMTYDLDSKLTNDTNIYNFYINKIVPTEIFPLIPKSYSTQTAIMVSNTASLRYPLFKGEVNLNDIITTCPFNDTFQYITGINGSLLVNLVAFLNKDTSTLQSHRVPPTNDDDLPKFITSDIKIQPDVEYVVVGFGYDTEVFQRTLSSEFKKEVILHQFDTVVTDSLTLARYISEVYPCKT